MPLRRTRSRRPFRSSTNRDISRGRRAETRPADGMQKTGWNRTKVPPRFSFFRQGGCSGDYSGTVTGETDKRKHTGPGHCYAPVTASQAKRGDMPADAVRKISVRASPTKGSPRSTRMSTRCSGSGDRSRNVTPHAPQHNMKRAESLAGFRSLTVAGSAGNQYCSFSLGKSPDFTSSM